MDSRGYKLSVQLSVQPLDSSTYKGGKCLFRSSVILDPFEGLSVQLSVHDFPLWNCIVNGRSKNSVQAEWKLFYRSPSLRSKELQARSNFSDLGFLLLGGLVPLRISPDPLPSSL